MSAPQLQTYARHFDTLGKLSWLWMNSPLQNEWSMAGAARFLLPAIELGQYYLVERDGLPVAYCSWACLSEAAELRYLHNPSAVLASDWNSGDRVWVVDWIAPFQAHDAWRMRAALMKQFPDQLVRAIRVKKNQARAHVMHFHGRALSAESARQRADSYYAGFCRAMRQSC